MCFGCFLLPELENKNLRGKEDTVLGGRAVSEELIVLGERISEEWEVMGNAGKTRWNPF